MYKKKIIEILVLNSFRVISILAFLYFWVSYSELLIAFSDNSNRSFDVYLITFLLNMGLLFSAMPFRKIYVYVSFVPLLVTSFSSIQTLLYGQAKEFGMLGLVSNVIAVSLFLYNGIYLKRGKICLKKLRI